MYKECVRTVTEKRVWEIGPVVDYSPTVGVHDPDAVAVGIQHDLGEAFGHDRVSGQRTPDGIDEIRVRFDDWQTAKAAEDIAVEIFDRNDALDVRVIGWADQ